MDVINLSLGEPEVEPSRDIVVAGARRRRRRRRRAGRRGRQRLPGRGARLGRLARPTRRRRSPSPRPRGDDGPPTRSRPSPPSGPTPISLQMKPDVTAPGVDILSSVPGHQWSGRLERHEHGDAARRRRRRAAQAAPSDLDGRSRSSRRSSRPAIRCTRPTRRTRSPSTREGGGRIDLPRADNPLIFTDPTGLSFGLVRRGATATQQLAVADAGGGAAPWTVDVAPQATPAGVDARRRRPDRRCRVVADRHGSPSRPTPPRARRPASSCSPAARTCGASRTGSASRRRSSRSDPHTTLATPGVYHGNTAGQGVARLDVPLPGARHRRAASRLDLSGPGAGLPLHARRRPVANFGAVVIERGDGRARLAAARPRRRREPSRRLHRPPGEHQPVRRPRRRRTRSSRPSSRPRARTTSSSTRRPAASRAAFTFRFWVERHDAAGRPAAHAHRLARRSAIRLAVTDAGSGVDPALADRVRSTASAARFAFAHGVHRRCGRTASPPGSHRLAVTASDYQETKNMEDVGPILPNTRTLSDDRRRPLAVELGGPSPRSSAAARGRARRSRRSRRRRLGTTRSDGLPLLALAAAARFGADARLQPWLEPRPFRSDHDCDRQREQGDVQPAHGTDLSEGASRRSKPIRPSCR